MIRAYRPLPVAFGFWLSTDPFIAVKRGICRHQNWYRPAKSRVTRLKYRSIVEIHGLNPWNNPDHAFDTWRKPKGIDGRLWLRDDLSNITPYVRIFLYKYNSNPVFRASKERFVLQANDLLETIYSDRHDLDAARPLIFFGHSLSAILTKQVCEYI